jgi:hypothetical protein
MTNPLKSILIEGLLEQEDLKHYLCPDYFQLHSGLWEIAVGSIAFTALENTTDYIFHISSNLVQGDKIINGHLRRFNIVLQQFKISKNIDKDLFVYQKPLWFLINQSPSDNFSLFLSEWPNSTKRPKNILLAINILLRRVV